MNKRGTAIASFYAVVIIIFIISVLVLVVLVSKIIPDSGVTYRQTCKTSVVSRGTFNIKNTIDIGRLIIPLKCKTEKICFSSNNQECKDKFGSDLQKNFISFEKVRDSDKTEEIKAKVLHSTADAIYWCDDILGKGEINFMPTPIFEKNYCIICQRIYFNDGVYDKVKDIKYQDLYTMMHSKKTSSGTTYLKDVYGFAHPDVPKLFFSGIISNPEVQEKYNKLKEDMHITKDIGYDELKLFYSNDNVVIAQMRSGERFWQVFDFTGGTSVGVIGGGAIALGLVSGGGIGLIPLAIGILVTGTSGGVILGGISASVATPDGAVYTKPIVVPYNSQILKELNCDSFEELP